MSNDIDNGDDSEDNDSNWQTVTTNNSNKRNFQWSPNANQQKKQKTMGDDVPSTSTNKFAPLSNEASEDAKEDNSPKPPPIFIPNVTNVIKMINNISKVIPGNDFNYKSLRNGQVKLMVKTIDSFRKLVKSLETSNISHHTYQVKQERSYRVVIKGIHHTTPISDIKSKLISSGHAVRNIANVKSRGSKEPLPMFFVDLEPKPNNKDVYNIHDINKAIVTIEPPKRTDDLVQCHRCQMFGHSKAYCKRPFRCVKCGLDHSTAECTKNTKTPPRCTNCLKNHTANYKGCKIYRELLQKKLQNSYADRSHTHRVNNFNNFTTSEENPRATNRTREDQSANRQMPLYSEVIQANNSSTSFMSKIEAMLSKQMELTNTLISMMSVLISKLCN